LLCVRLGVNFDHIEFKIGFSFMGRAMVDAYIAQLASAEALIDSAAQQIADAEALVRKLGGIRSFQVLSDIRSRLLREAEQVRKQRLGGEFMTQGASQ
jgi:hypothetical protein